MKDINTKLPKLPPPTRPTPVMWVARRYPMKTVVIKNRKLRLYSLSWLARMAGKHPRTIHSWESRGVFPTPIFKLVDNYRWYSAAEINAYTKLVKAAGMRYGVGRPRKGMTPQSDWLRRNSFEVKRQIKEHFDKKFDCFPERLSGEDALLKSFAKAPTLQLSDRQFIKLINGL